MKNKIAPVLSVPFAKRAILCDIDALQKRFLQNLKNPETLEFWL